MVLRLGSEDYSTREKSKDFLISRGYDARIAVTYGAKHRDLEISRSCRMIRSQPDFIEGVALSLEPVPEIDAAWYDMENNRYDPSLNEKVWNDYNRMIPYLNHIGRDNNPWYNYYDATRLWVRGELSQGADPKDLEKLLNDMHIKDRAFQWHYFHQWYRDSWAK